MPSKTGYNRLIVAMVILPITLRPFFEVVYERLEFILKQLEKFWNLNLQSWQKYDGIPWTPFLNDSDNRLSNHESWFVCILLGLKVANSWYPAKQCFPEVSHSRIKIKLHHRFIAASNLTITMNISLCAHYTCQLSASHIRRTLTSCAVTTAYRLDKVKHCATFVNMLAGYEFWVRIHTHIGRTSMIAGCEWRHQVTWEGEW